VKQSINLLLFHCPHQFFCTKRRTYSTKGCDTDTTSLLLLLNKRRRRRRLENKVSQNQCLSSLPRQVSHTTIRFHIIFLKSHAK
jgi:hypothetical protein